MNVTQRGQLSPEDEQRLLATNVKYAETLVVRAIYQQTVVEMIGKSSYREVSRLTGLSTNTLQRWKREAE